MKSERGHKSNLNPGTLVDELNGVYLRKDVDFHDVARGGTKMTRRGKWTVTANNEMTWFDTEKSARPWFYAWAQKVK